MMSLATNIIVQTPFYLLGAAFALLNLKVLLSGLSGAATGSIGNHNSIVQAIKPVLKPLWSVLKEIFGKPESMAFTIEHVLLLAVLLAVLGVVSSVNSLRESTDRQTSAVLQLVQQQRVAAGGADRKKDD